MTERAREALARARDLAGRSAEARALAAELIVITDDLCSRARAECERARELATERLRRHHTAPVALQPGARRPPQAVNRFSPGQAQTAAATRRSSSTSASAAAVPTSAIRDLRPVCRRV